MLPGWLLKCSFQSLHLLRKEVHWKSNSKWLHLKPRYLLLSLRKTFTLSLYTLVPKIRKCLLHLIKYHYLRWCLLYQNLQAWLCHYYQLRYSEAWYHNVRLCVYGYNRVTKSNLWQSIRPLSLNNMVYLRH